MPDCNYFEELCSAALDGELTRSEKRELEEHLKTCPACAEYSQDLKTMRAGWGDFKEPLSDALHEQIMQAVLAEAEHKVQPLDKKRRKLPVFTMIGAAAACVMLVMSGVVGDLIGVMEVDAAKPAAAESANNAAAEGFSAAGASSFVDQDKKDVQSQDDAVSKEKFAASSQADGGQKQEKASEPEKKTKEQSDEAPLKSQAPQQNEAQIQEAPQGRARIMPFTSNSSDVMTAQSKNAAEDLSITLPSDLQTYRFGFCYVAVGSGDPPVLENASLIEKGEGVYYFRIENSMSGLEKMRKNLQDAGFDTALRSDINIAVDEDASDSLLILSIQ